MILITKQTPLESVGRILELESGLCKPRAEIRLVCLSHKRGAGIHDSSPKANDKGVLK